MKLDGSNSFFPSGGRVVLLYCDNVMPAACLPCANCVYYICISSSVNHFGDL